MYNTAYTILVLFLQSPQQNLPTRKKGWSYFGAAVEMRGGIYASSLFLLFHFLVEKGLKILGNKGALASHYGLYLECRCHE